MAVHAKSSLIRLLDNIYAVPVTIAAYTRFPGVYAFILVRQDPPGIILFDTGGLGSGRIIYNAMKANGLNPDDLKAVAITHWHADHTGGLAELAKMLDPASKPLKVYMGDKDIILMLDRKPHKLVIHPNLRIPVAYMPGRTPPPEDAEFIPLTPGSDENPLSDWDIEYIPTPGHTPGHTSYLHRPTGSLFSGCGLSLIGKNTVGIHFMSTDHKKALESARMLAKTDFTYHWPVHWGINMAKIPRDKRVPIRKDAVFWTYRILGFYPLFRYPAT